MAGMGDGYVGTAADSARIRRLEKQREEEQAKMEELRKKSSQGLQGLLQFGTATSETLETAFKKQTVGLVTREQFVEKRATLRSKMEEEEREAKQRHADDEEEKQMEKRRRRRAAAPTAKLSFLDDLQDEEEEEDGEEDGEAAPTAKLSFLDDLQDEEEEGEGEDGDGDGEKEKGREQEDRAAGNGASRGGGGAAGEVRKKARMSKFGKNPSVETGFLPDRCGARRGEGGGEGSEGARLPSRRVVLAYERGGAVVSAGVRAVVSAGVRAVVSAGVRAVVSAGVRAVVSAGVGAVVSAGVRAVVSAGVGAVVSAGVGAVVSAGVGAGRRAGGRAKVGYTWWSSFETSQHTGAMPLYPLHTCPSSSLSPLPHLPSPPCPPCPTSLLPPAPPPFSPLPHLPSPPCPTSLLPPAPPPFSPLPHLPSPPCPTDPPSSPAPTTFSWRSCISPSSLCVISSPCPPFPYLPPFQPIDQSDEPLEITYSFWDGAGHRRVIKVRKGDSIADFLRAVQQQLAPDFREVRSASVEGLVYIKEDLIIPHQYTFYELIVNKARGKSGPLFHFDVHDDIRTTGDATIEKDESHAGKVVERHWYDKNKHIFPASRWEAYGTGARAARQQAPGGAD
ncbi:unnamed protein product [Closterium sp. Naga37s-1]|nr:unnamed protein product [Closterium sp. Naga37s-1]